MRGQRVRGKKFACVFVVGVAVFLFSPLLLMVLFSFHSEPRMSFPFSGVSLRWYADIFSDVEVLRGIRNSAIIAIIVSILCTVLALLASLGILALKQRTRGAFYLMAMIPMSLPSLLYGIGLIVLLGLLSIPSGFVPVIIGHTTLALPFVFLILNSALERFGFSMVEAARDLGATGMYAFRTVTLPIIRPGVVGAMLLAMSLSIDEFIVTFFTAGSDKTLPLVMYGRLNMKLDPSLDAIGTVLLVMTSALAYMSARQTAKELD